ncbi:CLK4-associating serine/arginine rich protein isoform X2 [Centruroides vittatus]|uniref:CLK4-associating serine/arginine rich protein isoform X2 n=1 Tax=Centruroides vittatus TaxID=120091 RepID=UPI00350EAE72
MWHEARKQEKKIRGMMVDYKRRAERRREYYEKIDPAQFLQVHGRPCKIHLDPAVALAADSPATMMPWQGHTDNLIDRFDVRAHLDIIPEYKPSSEPQKLSAEEMFEDRQVCYERYRTLVQNDFLGVSEDKFLYQIYLEEHFGPVVKSTAEEDKKRLADKKVAIGYVYEDSQPQLMHHHDDDDDDDDDDKKDDLSDIDLDVTLDVDQLTSEQSTEMNENSTKYGMVGDDFISFLHQDKEETEQLRLAKELEEEKAMYSGRKSRRERRALREKKLQGRRVTSPPSYAARESPTYKPFQRTHSTSRSRSPSPVEGEHITFITSFGVGSDEETTADVTKKQTSQQLQTKNLGGKLSEKTLRSKKTRAAGTPGNSLTKGKQHLQEHLKSRHYSSSSSRSSCGSDHGKKTHRLQKHQSRRREHSHSSSSRSSSRSRSRSSTISKSAARRNYDRSYRTHSRTYNSRSRSRSRSWSRSRSRSRSRSKSWPRIKHYSRSRSRSVSPEEKKSQSRSPPNLPPPPIKSYYRHSLSRSSSDPSDRSADEEEKTSVKPPVEVPSKTQPLLGKAGPSTKSKLTPQERLKKRMQMALNRQYKADKRAQMEKYEKQQQERQDRAEELREMAIRMRQRERERRHRMLESEREPESDSSWNRHSEHYGKDDDREFRRRKDDSDSHSPKSGYSHRRSRSRSKDRSPRRISPRRNSPRRTPPRRSKARNRSRSPSPRQRYHQSHRHSANRSSSRTSSLRSTKPLVDY